MSSSSSSSSCSTLSCLKNCNQDECMLVRQFLDFNPTGAVYLHRVIPVPCCQEVAGLKGSKNRLCMKFQEMRAPFFVEVAREHPGTCGKNHYSRTSCTKCTSHRSRTSCASHRSGQKSCKSHSSKK
uniref:Uncharacterized protein n=1 Tax=viral metagenome TaxID=1070528 RepID=A0A6C0BLK7_9ZZZZ